MDRDIYHLQAELKETFEKLEMIRDTFDKIELKQEANQIKVGSRVLITYSNGTLQEGRVCSVKPGRIYGINRDGYKETINLDFNGTGLTIQNLSVGTYGRLEREKWLLSRKSSQLQRQIDGLIEAKIRDSFSTEYLTKADIAKVIDSHDFLTWYKDICGDSNFPPIDAWHEELQSGIAKQFLSVSASAIIYNLLIKDRAK